MIVVAVILIVMLGPALWYQEAPSEFTPDMMYIKAKVNYVLEGNIFGDPVTGVTTFHPPAFHVALGAIKALGLNFSPLLWLVFMFDMAVVFGLFYAISRELFDEETAMTATAWVPFVMAFIGAGALLLANAYSFSMMFFLAGFWSFLRRGQSLRFSLLAGLLWGLGFLISPVYVFMLGFIFAYVLFVEKNIKAGLASIAAFLVTLIPFYVQVYDVYSQGLQGTAAFAFWRGVPDAEWIGRFFAVTLGGPKQDVSSPSGLMSIALFATAGLAMWRQRRVPWYLAVAGLAYLFTYYHFNAQYAARMQFFLFLFAAMVGMNWLLTFRGFRPLVWAGVALVCIYSVYWHYKPSIVWYDKMEQAEADYTGWLDFRDELQELVKPGEYIFCTKDTYLHYVMPLPNIHALGCYRTMEYFQLNARLSKQLEDDYNTVINTEDFQTAMTIASRYGIRTAVFKNTMKEVSLPLFTTLKNIWPIVYNDGQITIMRRAG